MSPAADADHAIEDVERPEEAFEDERADVEGAFSAELDGGDGGASGVGEIAEKADRLTDFFEIEDLAVNPIGLPDGELFADGDEVGAGGAEGDGDAGGVRSVFEADELVEGLDGVEALAEGWGFVGEEGFAEAEGSDGVAAAEEGVPAGGGAVCGDEFGAVAAGINDAEAGVVGEEGIVGDGEEAEVGFFFAGDDGERRALFAGGAEELGGIVGDAQGHGSGGEDVAGSVFMGEGEEVFEGFEGAGGAFGGEAAGGFGAGTEAGDAAGFVDGCPDVVLEFGDEEEGGV